ncbi:hypothetical protein [Flavobacterium koreense]
MKRNIVLLLSICILLLNCKKKNSTVTENSLKKDSAVIENKVVTESDSEKYWDADTLLIQKYKSDSENEIELRGSQSKDLYYLNIKTKSGKIYRYQIADNPYAASHSLIEWDNSDYVFVRQGCGTMCWNGKLLNISGKEKVSDFLFYLYSDSIKNYIAFADSIDTKKIILQNLKTLKKREISLDLCEEAVMPNLTIDTIYETGNKSLLIRYTKGNCKDKSETQIKLP